MENNGDSNIKRFSDFAKQGIGNIIARHEHNRALTAAALKQTRMLTLYNDLTVEVNEILSAFAKSIPIISTPQPRTIKLPFNGNLCDFSARLYADIAEMPTISSIASTLNAIAYDRNIQGLSPFAQRLFFTVGVRKISSLVIRAHPSYGTHPGKPLHYTEIGQYVGRLCCVDNPDPMFYISSRRIQHLDLGTKLDVLVDDVWVSTRLDYVNFYYELKGFPCADMVGVWARIP